MLDTHLPRAAEVLADMFFRSRFDEADVENEKGVIGEEIDMYEDTPEDVAAENLLAGCFPGALGRPVLGTEETLAGLSGRSLRAFMERTYTAPRIAVALAGSFTDADVDAVASIFAQMPPAEHTEPERSAYAPCLTLREKAVEQNQLVLGFPGLETASEERFAMQLFSNILGGSSSSRLFQTVREKHGLCYSIYSFTAGYQDTGLFAVALAANRQSERRALGLTIDELRRIRDEGDTAAELGRAREQVTASILMSLESSASRMNRLGYGELFLPGGALTPDELIERYEAVTLADVRSLAQRTLDFRRASLSAVGRVADGEEYRAALLSGAK